MEAEKAEKLEIIKKYLRRMNDMQLEALYQFLFALKTKNFENIPDEKMAGKILRALGTEHPTEKKVRDEKK